MKNFKHLLCLLLWCTGIFLSGHLQATNSTSGYFDYTDSGTAYEGLRSEMICYTPTWPSTSNITQTTATFSWSGVSGAISYSVQTRLPGGTWYDIPNGPVYSNWVTVTGFSPSTTYEWRVRTNCGGGEYSAWTYPVTFTTSGSSCLAPGWLYTLYITQTTATFDWDPAPGAINYSIQWRQQGNNWLDLPGGPWTETWLYMGGLQPGTTYEWRVRSNCAYGVYSPWSYTAVFTTLGGSCSTPTWPTTYNITSTSATFSWDYVSGANSYTVQTRLPNGYWYDIPGGPVYSTWATVTGLNPNTTYQWRVRANCYGGQYSYWTYPISFTTLGYSCATPTWPTTSNITSSSATFSWDAVYGAVSYSVQIRLLNGYWYDLPGSPVYSTWATATGLSPNTTYEWRVRTNCYGGQYSNWTYPKVFTTLGYSCGVPTWPSTSSITQSSATFSWSGVAGAISYTVQIKSGNGLWYDLPGGVIYSNWVTAYNLMPNTTYQWRVRSNCSNWQYSNWTYPTTFTTLGEPNCYAPSWINTSNITANSATLNWSYVSGALSYSIQWRYPGGAWNDVYGGPGSGTWYTLTNLQPGTSYEWRVRSNCHYGNYSPWSYIGYFTTVGYSCATPTWPTTSNITSTTATFSWDAVYGAQSYTVQTRLLNGAWYDIPGGNVYGTWATVTGLSPNTTYQWRVRANCSNWQYSYWTNPITFTTLGASCYAPGWLFTNNITQTTATFDWDPVNGAVSYSIQWRYAGGTWYDLQGGPWTNTWVNVGNLQPGTAYEWRVRSNCSYGNYSPWSYPASFTTLGNACGVPTWPTTYNITETTASFSWSAVSGALNYTVQTRLLNDTWYDIPGGPVSGTSVTVTGLSPNTTYQWRVKANCYGGQSSYWTSPITFTTTGSGSGGSGSDECIGASTLPVNSYCVNTAATNVNSTPSVPAPQGGCPSSNYKDVWFKFNMPGGSDPVVTIRTTAGTLTDAVMELYVGEDCSSLVYLACEDDNVNGNYSTMPVLSVTGYANETIWVRVWGYNGAKGSFNICVFDHYSVNYAGNITSTVETTSELPVEIESVEMEVADVPIAVHASPKLLVSPNPAHEFVRLSLLLAKESHVTAVVLYDISGKIVVRKNYQAEDRLEFEEQLDVSELTPGIYILQVMTTEGMLSEKVSVVNY